MKPKSLKAGSDKYGDCELCGKNMDTAYFMFRDEKNKSLAAFGHKECLEGENNGKRTGF